MLFNQLCARCETVFGSCEQRVTTFPFHSLTDLKHSAESECHFCHVLLSQVQDQIDDGRKEGDHDSPSSSSNYDLSNDTASDNEVNDDLNPDEQINSADIGCCKAHIRVEGDLGLSFSLSLGSLTLTIIELHWEDRLG